MRDPSTLVHIYALVDPRTGAVRYIGQTGCTLRTRLANHLSAARSAVRAGIRGGPSVYSRWMRDLVVAGYEPSIRLIDIVPAGVADDAERGYIRAYRVDSHTLTNAPIAPSYAHGRINDRAHAI